MNHETQISNATWEAFFKALFVIVSAGGSWRERMKEVERRADLAFHRDALDEFVGWWQDGIDLDDEPFPS